jgi:hypothetical protein
VTLCGSTRFKREFIEANFRETMAGRIVLSVGWFGHADHEVYELTDAEKIALDVLHFRKIDLSDEILVISERFYIGDSTHKEIQYAQRLGKPIRWWEPGAEEYFYAVAERQAEIRRNTGADAGGESASNRLAPYRRNEGEDFSGSPCSGSRETPETATREARQERMEMDR